MEDAPEDVLAVDAPAGVIAAPQSVPPHFVLAYCIEFLIAVIAALLLWSEVGGQPHMDLLPWYVKLALTVSMAWGVVRFTASLVAVRRWRACLWLGVIFLIAVLMGAITYYYHLQESPDQPGGDENTAAAVVAAPR